MIYVGIDIGKTGAITLLDNNANIIEKHNMPIIKGKRNEYDIKGIVELFEKIKQEHNDMLVIMENCICKPLNGKLAIASLFQCNGIFQGILSSFKIPYLIFNPKDWQKEVFKGIPRTDTKQASIMFCQRRYPNENFYSSERAKTISNDICDSICIAYYGWLIGSNK